MPKVFDVECALETRGEESSEWRDEGRKRRHDQKVQVVRRIRDGGDGAAKLSRDDQCPHVFSEPNDLQGSTKAH